MVLAWAGAPSVLAERHVFDESSSNRHCAPFCARIGMPLRKTRSGWKNGLWGIRRSGQLFSVGGSKHRCVRSSEENRAEQSTDSAIERVALPVQKSYRDRDSRFLLSWKAWR